MTLQIPYISHTWNALGLALQNDLDGIQHQARQLDTFAKQSTSIPEWLGVKLLGLSYFGATLPQRILAPLAYGAIDFPAAAISDPIATARSIPASVHHNADAMQSGGIDIFNANVSAGLMSLADGFWGDLVMCFPLAKGLTKMGIFKAVDPIAETPLARELADAAERATFSTAIIQHQARLQAGLRTAAQNPEAFNAWMRDGGVLGSQRGAVGVPPAPQVSHLIQKLRIPLLGIMAQLELIEIIQDSRNTTLHPQHITDLLALLSDVQGGRYTQASTVLYNVSINRSELFLPAHIDSVLAMAKQEPHAYYINYTVQQLAHHRSELFTPSHLARLVVANNGWDLGSLRSALNMLQKGRVATRPPVGITAEQFGSSLSDALNVLQKRAAAEVSQLMNQIEQIGTGGDVVSNLKKQARVCSLDFTPSVITALIQKLKVHEISEAHIVPILEALIDNRPPRFPFQSHHVTELVAVMSEERGRQRMVAAQILYNLANSPHSGKLFTTDHIDPMITVAAESQRTFYANGALARVAAIRSDLFTPDKVTRIKEANRNSSLGNYLCLKDTLDVLGKSSTSQTHPVETVSASAATLTGHVQVAQLLGISTENLPDVLRGIAQASQEGLPILIRCGSEPEFRNNLIAALRHMQTDTTYSSWLSDALKRVQGSAADKPRFEID